MGSTPGESRYHMGRVGAASASQWAGSSGGPREPEVRKDRRPIPKLKLEQHADPAAQWDRFEQWLNQVQTAVATWNSDSEDYWSHAVRCAREGYNKMAAQTPAERALSGGAAMRLLGLRVPQQVPLLEKVLRAEFVEAIPAHIARECSLKLVEGLSERG